MSEAPNSDEEVPAAAHAFAPVRINLAKIVGDLLFDGGAAVNVVLKPLGLSLTDLANRNPMSQRAIINHRLAAVTENATVDQIQGILEQIVQARTEASKPSEDIVEPAA